MNERDLLNLGWTPVTTEYCKKHLASQGVWMKEDLKAEYDHYRSRWRVQIQENPFIYQWMTNKELREC